MLDLMPQFISTFGASAFIMSPLFDLLLVGVAVMLIIAFFKLTQADSFFRNLLAGYGLFELLRSSFNSFFSAPSPSTFVPIHVHPEEMNVRPSHRPVSHIHVHHSAPSSGSFHRHSVFSPQSSHVERHPGPGRMHGHD